MMWTKKAERRSVSSDASTSQSSTDWGYTSLHNFQSGHRSLGRSSGYTRDLDESYEEDYYNGKSFSSAGSGSSGKVALSTLK